MITARTLFVDMFAYDGPIIVPYEDAGVVEFGVTGGLTPRAIPRKVPRACRISLAHSRKGIAACASVLPHELR